MKIKESELHLFAQIGLLSTTFASIEHQVQTILECYITKGETNNMLVGQLFDKQSMHQKLQSLEKAVLFEFSNKDLVRSFIEKVRKHSEKRNHFIHGEWMVLPSVGEQVVCVFHKNVKKVYPPIKNPGKDNPGWQKGYEHFYSLSHLESVNKQLKEIQIIGKEILNGIEKGNFEFY